MANQLTVRLERDECYAGGTVKGMLVVENASPLSLLEHPEATVAILGFEKTSWIFRRKKMLEGEDFTWEKTDCGGKATFLKAETKVSFLPPTDDPGCSRSTDHDATGAVLEPGTHEFPFSFELPDTVPPTMLATPPDFVTPAQTAYGDIKAEVAYRVQASSRGPFESARAPFRVVEEPKAPSGKPLVCREVLDMETVRCGCFRTTSSRGVEVTLQVDKDAMVAGDVLQPGDFTSVTIEVHNRTWSNFGLGYLTLRQRLLLGDLTEHSGLCERNLRRVKLPPVPARARLTGDKAIRVQLRAPDNIDPAITEGMCNSLITNSYSLQLLLLSEGCGGAAFVELILPYHVRPRPLAVKLASASRKMINLESQKKRGAAASQAAGAGASAAAATHHSQHQKPAPGQALSKGLSKGPARLQPDNQPAAQPATLA